MTVTNDEQTLQQMREFLEILHNATPEIKNCLLITLIAAAQTVEKVECKLPECSRAEYKRYIKRLRQQQHTNPTPQARELAAKSIELIRTVCPIQ